MPVVGRAADNPFLGWLVIRIDVINEQTRVPVDADRLRAALHSIVTAHGKHRGTISLAVVDDPTIHELNRRYLEHDYPTDVLSFAFDDDEDTIEGEIIVSGDTAATTAGEYGWAAEDEMLLYVIHGGLHLVGFDDKSPADAARMRAQESMHLASFGVRSRTAQVAVESVPSRVTEPRLLAEGRPS